MGIVNLFLAVPYAAAFINEMGWWQNILSFWGCSIDRLFSCLLFSGLTIKSLGILILSLMIINALLLSFFRFF